LVSPLEDNNKTVEIRENITNISIYRVIDETNTKIEFSSDLNFQILFTDVNGFKINYTSDIILFLSVDFYGCKELNQTTLKIPNEWINTKDGKVSVQNTTPKPQNPMEINKSHKCPVGGLFHFLVRDGEGAVLLFDRVEVDEFLGVVGIERGLGSEVGVEDFNVLGDGELAFIFVPISRSIVLIVSSHLSNILHFSCMLVFS